MERHRYHWLDRRKNGRYDLQLTTDMLGIGAHGTIDEARSQGFSFIGTSLTESTWDHAERSGSVLICNGKWQKKKSTGSFDAHAVTSTVLSS